jgi:transcriptional regulator with XRE-family HTH domain
MRTKEDIAVTIGRKVRDLRLKNNMTMEALALESGMDYSQLSRIERGKINTSVYHIYLIANVLKVPIQEMFDGVDGI